MPLVVSAGPSGMRMPMASSLTALTPALEYWPMATSRLEDRCSRFITAFPHPAAKGSTHLDQLHGAIRQHFGDVAAGLAEQLGETERDDGGGGDGQEKSRRIEKSEGGERGHSADIAEGTGESGDLSGHAALDQRHDAEHRARPR